MQHVFKVLFILLMAVQTEFSFAQLQSCGRHRYSHVVVVEMPDAAL